MSRKVFTAGEVLAAADVNSFLMDQTVMSFAGTAARGSAIPSPTLGMYTHLEDAPPRTQFWNGSAFVSPFGTTLITSQTFTTATVINLNNVFTSAFENYRIEVRGIGSAYGLFNVRMRAGGTDSATGYFRSGITAYTGVANLDTTRVSDATTTFLTEYNDEPFSGTMTLYRPALVDKTTVTSFFQGRSVGGNGYTTHPLTFVHTVSAAYDGISFLPSVGNVTGILRVYGLRNA